MADNMNVTVRDPLAPRRQMPPIVIGRAGEYGATTVTFDLRGLIDRYGAGIPTLLHKRPPDDEAYIVPPSAADTETHDRTEMPDSETLVWHVGQVATSYVGNGKIELQWHPDGAAKKSAQFDVVVLGTIGNPVSEIPDAQQIYLDVMQGIADDAEDAADRAEAAVSHYPQIRDGYWCVWDAEESEWKNTEVKATGLPGDPGTPGVSPAVTITAIEGGHRVTITDADGAHTFDVMDGEGGSGGGGAVDSVNGKTGAVVLTASDVGAYVKPSGGIPASDLAQAVQTSLGKADTALQQHQSLAGYATESYVQTQIAAIPDELPAVTASDNGKVLAVNNGEWSADSPVIVSGTDAQVTNAVNDYLTQYGVPLRLSEEIKQALLDCFENVAWINDQGQTYYDALYAALYPPKTLVSISAAFTQGSAVIYDTDTLDALKQYLTVTATYDDSSTGVVTDYTLSGTLTAGTSTITVSYSGKTTTFDVSVTGILPSEYQRVEYIANPSNAYITTTIPIALGNTVHVQSLLSAKPSATMNVCGGTAINQNRAYVSYSTSNNYVGAWVGYTNCFPLVADLYSSVLESWTTVPSGSVYFKGKNDSAEEEKTVSGITTELTALELFRAGSAGGAFVGRVYFLEVLNGSTATARLYPCYRKSDNKIGMYDTVNSKFYTSANTTAFTKGANV